MKVDSVLQDNVVVFVQNAPSSLPKIIITSLSYSFCYYGI